MLGGFYVPFFLRALCLFSFVTVDFFSLATETGRAVQRNGSTVQRNGSTVTGSAQDPDRGGQRAAQARAQPAADRNCGPGFLQLPEARDLQSDIPGHVPFITFLKDSGQLYDHLPGENQTLALLHPFPHFFEMIFSFTESCDQHSVKHDKQYTFTVLHLQLLILHMNDPYLVTV